MQRLNNKVHDLPAPDEYLNEPENVRQNVGVIKPKVINTAPNMLNFEQSDDVNIQFSNLTYCVPERSHCSHRGFKTILKNISGNFNSGQLSAVMGPSGAGKTSLLNVLAGYISHGIRGKVRMNNKKIDYKQLHKISAYIMQDDRLQVHLTVFESLKFASNLKCAPRPDEHDRIKNIIMRLGLIEARNTLTRNLSGGQKKRLAIALELVNNPPLMFFDEPTSGLDSQTSFHVLSLLRSLANAGRTVICTIHQPSARLYEIFDNLYVLQGGQTIYNGKTSNLVSFLSSQQLVCPKYHNPADFVMEVASGEFGFDSVRQLITATSALENEKKILADSGDKNTKMDTVFRKGYRAPFLKQLGILIQRQFLLTYRNPMVTHLRFISHIVVGLIFGGLCWNIGDDASKLVQNAAFVFLVMLFLCFSSLMPTLLQFPFDLNVMIAEHRNRWYSAGAYFLSKTLADIPFNIVLDMIFIVIAYFMSGQPVESERVFLFCVIIILNNTVTQSMGLLIGAASPSAEASIFVGPICTIPILLFAGFFIRISDLLTGWKWLTYITYFRYSYEAVLIVLYGNIGNGPRENFSECTKYDENSTQPEMIQCPTPQFVLSEEMLDVDEGSLHLHCIIIVIFFVILRFFAFLALQSKIYFHSQSIALRILYIMHKDTVALDYPSSATSSSLPDDKEDTVQIKNDIYLDVDT